MATDTGVMHYLASGDAVTHGVAWLLLAMSVASWCLLLLKAWTLVRAKRQGPAAIVAVRRAGSVFDRTEEGRGGKEGWWQWRVRRRADPKKKENVKKLAPIVSRRQDT